MGTKKTRYLVIGIILSLLCSTLVVGQVHKPLSKIGSKQDETPNKNKEITKEVKPLKEKIPLAKSTEVIKELKSILLKKPTADDFVQASFKPLNSKPTFSKENVNSKPEIIIPRYRPSKPTIISTTSKTNKPTEEELLTGLKAGEDYPDMVTIARGKFEMGSETEQKDEFPVHSVIVSSFEISKYEITNHEFQVFVKATGYQTQSQIDKQLSWQDYAKTGKERYPVIMITWDDAVAYCEWLSKVTGQEYRLPTEAEWEYAASGGKNSLKTIERYLEPTQANFATDIGRASDLNTDLKFLQEVGSYQPNGYQLYDMVGNVAEWCLDFYDEAYYQDSPEEDPAGPDNGVFIYRVTRGGGWSDPAKFANAKFRNAATVNYRSSSIGFRVVKVNSQN